MDKGIWQNATYVASEVAKDYNLEKQIRMASARGELCCPDPDCSSPIIKYCHGEKRNYFAHRTIDCFCDYALFDKRHTPILQDVKQSIYEHLSKCGYDVEIDVKVLPHHYTHLLVSFDAKKVAIELGTRQSLVTPVDDIASQYHKNDIGVKWIIVTDSEIPEREYKTFFMRRYSLNESPNNDVLEVHSNGSDLTQYIIDPNKYECNGEEITSQNYPPVYSEKTNVLQLTFENQELTIAGFYERYHKWLATKQKAFQKRVADEEEKKRQRLEEQQEENRRRREARHMEEEYRNEKREQERQRMQEIEPESTLRKICPCCQEEKPVTAFIKEICMRCHYNI